MVNNLIEREGVNGMSTGPDAHADKTLENQIYADIIHLHNLFQHLSLNRPGAHCLMKHCSLILGRAICGLTAVQKESSFSGMEGYFWEREGVLLMWMTVCPHVRLYISSCHNALQHPSESLNHYTTSSTRFLTHTLKSQLPWLHPSFRLFFFAPSIIFDSIFLIRKNSCSTACDSTLGNWGGNC